MVWAGGVATGVADGWQAAGGRRQLSVIAVGLYCQSVVADGSERDADVVALGRRVRSA